MGIGNPRSDQCHAAFIVLQQKGAHQSTGISSRLISRGRGGTDLTLLPPLFFLRPIISPLVPSSFFSLRPPRCAYPCARLSPPLLRITFLPRFVARSSFSWPSLAFLALLYPSPSLTVLSIPLAVPDVVEATPAGGVAGGGADRDGRGPGAVVMKTYEIYSIWADAITPPTTILPHSLDPCTLATA